MNARRIIDLLIAVTLLMFTSPLLLLLLGINLLITGKAFITQLRVGRDLKPFLILKLQTMVNGAEQGPTVTTAGDARITPLGRFLRILKLDELPQLMNVLQGSMSLIGPRPLTPNEVAMVPRDLARLVYRNAPGVTGISALAFADEERLLAGGDSERRYFEQILPCKIALELAYAQRQTWLTDLIIFILTPLAPFLPGLPRSVVQYLVPEWAGLSIALRPTAQTQMRVPSTGA